jgi:hypothetical protein
MRSTSIFNLFIGYLILFAWNSNKPVYSSIRILSCTGSIPQKTACIVKASSFKVKVKRIDICQKNPLPNYKSKPDFIRSKCINLLNNKVSAENLLNTNQKYEIPKNLTIENGNYRYISIIFENKFIASGSYIANNYFWTTSKKGSQDIIQSKSKLSNLTEFTTKLKNWRGKENLDNKYCKNNGGTASRCDLQYNGYEMSGIGLDSDFVETSGNNIKFLFFISELSPMVNLNQDSKGYIEINLKKNLEVFGDGSAVKSISIAPFEFETRFITEGK